MAKIPKNLSDKDMFSGFKEEQTFETMVYADEEPAPLKPKLKKSAANPLTDDLLTATLKEKLGRLLLEAKLELYKQGIVDYSWSATREGDKIILSPKAVPQRANIAKRQTGR